MFENANYAEDPKIHLDKRGKEKMADVSRKLWWRFYETISKNVFEARLKHRAMRLGDNFGDGSATQDDVQDDLFRPENEPF
jgi:hypothetical protein